jgi:hypothetical protein
VEIWAASDWAESGCPEMEERAREVKAISDLELEMPVEIVRKATKTSRGSEDIELTVSYALDCLLSARITQTYGDGSTYRSG